MIRIINLVVAPGFLTGRRPEGQGPIAAEGDAGSGDVQGPGDGPGGGGEVAGEGLLEPFVGVRVERPPVKRLESTLSEGFRSEAELPHRRFCLRRRRHHCELITAQIVRIIRLKYSLKKKR